ILMDAHGDLWVLSDHVAWVRHAMADRFEPLPPLPKGVSFDPFLGDPVLSVDSSSNVIATSSNGLCRWDQHQWTVIDGSMGLPRTDVTAMAAGREGSVWVGIGGLGLARWLGYGEWQSWGTPEGLPHDAIWALDRDSAGKVWVGTFGGLAFASAEFSSPFRWTARPEFAGRMVLSLAHSRDHSEWIGTGNDGVWRIDSGTGHAKSIDVGTKNLYGPQV